MVEFELVMDEGDWAALLADAEMMRAEEVEELSMYLMDELEPA